MVRHLGHLCKSVVSYAGKKREKKPINHSHIVSSMKKAIAITTTDTNATPTQYASCQVLLATRNPRRKGETKGETRKPVVWDFFRQALVVVYRRKARQSTNPQRDLTSLQMEGEQVAHSEKTGDLRGGTEKAVEDTHCFARISKRW